MQLREENNGTPSAEKKQILSHRLVGYARQRLQTLRGGTFRSSVRSGYWELRFTLKSSLLAFPVVSSAQELAALFSYN